MAAVADDEPERPTQPAVAWINGGSSTTANTSAWLTRDYDLGGWLPPGLAAFSVTGVPEPVLPAQWTLS